MSTPNLTGMELCAWDGFETTKTRIRVTVHNGDKVGVVELEIKFGVRDVFHNGFDAQTGLPNLVVRTTDPSIRYVVCDPKVRRREKQ